LRIKLLVIFRSLLLLLLL